MGRLSPCVCVQVGFTTMSEQLPPKEVMMLLNRCAAVGMSRVGLCASQVWKCKHPGGNHNMSRMVLCADIIHTLESTSWAGLVSGEAVQRTALCEAAFFARS